MTQGGSDGGRQNGDSHPSIDDLTAYEEATRESRKRCGESIEAAIACGKAIADIIARRLSYFAGQTPPPPHEFVERARAAETVMRAWMGPLRAARELIGAAGMDHLEYGARAAIATLALQQEQFKKTLPDFATVLSLMSRLAGAKTPEERLAIILDVPDEDLLAGARLRAEQEAQRERLNTLVGRAAVILAEVAGTYGALLGYVVARQLYLTRFIEATKYFDDVPDIEKLGFELSIEGAVKAATVALDFLVTKLGPRLLQQIPIVGIGAGAVEVLREMRHKRQALQERTLLIKQQREALIGRNFTWELVEFEGDLKDDADKLKELHTLVDRLGEFLRHADPET